MKSQDRYPQAALHDATPEPAVAEPQSEQSGSVGKVPIAVSEGDFSTPSVRKRTITRPRGLRTLEQSSPIAVPETPSVQVSSPPTVEVMLTPPPVMAETPAAVVAEPEVLAGSFEVGAAPATAQEASAVDEFLAAPPTPEPEIALTPAPDLVPSMMADFAPTRGSEGAIENLEAASQLRDAARGGDAVHMPTPPPPEPASSEVPADADQLFVDGLLAEGATNLASSAPSSGVGGGQPDGPQEIHDSGAWDAPEAGAVAGDHLAVDAAALGSAPLTPMPESAAASVLPPVHADAQTEYHPTPPPAGEGAPDGELSPLAQTLAHMAEAMQGQGEIGGEPALDIDIADAPLVQLPAEALTPGPPRAVPPPPPAQAAAAGASADTGRTPVPAALVGLPEALAERPRRPKRSKPWFEEVFDESYLRTLPFMTANQTLREVDFIESSLAIPKGGEVLDVGCGYGRHAIELVQRGLTVTGLDLSLPLLIRAADESQRRSVSVNFMHADMREMTFDRQFAGAYCMLTSFGYFDEESNLKVAEGIARSLKPGGRFLLDVLNRDYIVGDLPARVWWEGDGCVVLEEVDFNFNTNRVLTHRSVVFEDGQQLEQEISVRVYSLHELGKLLRQAGFRVLEVSGSIPTRGHFFGANSRNLLILAERRAD